MKRPWLVILPAALLSTGIFGYAFMQESEDALYSIGLLTSVRLSSVYFLIAFTAGPLFRLSRIGLARLFLANRRYIGLAFALLHSVHLFFIYLWVTANPDQVDMVVLIGGGIAFILMYLQALTSNQYSVRKLGRTWGWLHTVAMYYIWLILTITFAGSSSNTAKTYTALLFLAMGLRLLARLNKPA